MKFIYYKDKNRRTDYDEGNQCSNLNLLRRLMVLIRMES